MGPDLIPADVRTRLRGLRLTARRAVDRHGLGLHHSNARGAGLEFAQYRGYEPGDEPRAIDWKLYARSDRFFVREAERESPLAVWLLVDASASMRQEDAGRPGWSRLAAARGLAATIAELALAQGDRFGFAALSDTGLGLVAADTGARHRDRLAFTLGRLTAGGGFPSAAVLAPVWGRIGARDLAVVISDWLDPAALDFAERLAAAGREVLAIEILTVGERDFRFSGGQCFHDPETGAEIIGDGAALRAGFLARFGAARAALRARFDRSGIAHAVLVLDEPLDLPLRRLFGAQAAAEYR
jgi:uncharacterized protein (DUF58 family)